MKRHVDPALTAKLRDEFGLPPVERPTANPRDIRALRHALGLTQVEFARHLGVATATVNKWERGLRDVGWRCGGKLERMLVRARECDALKYDPESTKQTRDVDTQTQYRCTKCGDPYRACELATIKWLEDGRQMMDHYHGRFPDLCGPVVTQHRRLRRVA